jgi:hypothetical protein
MVSRKEHIYKLKEKAAKKLGSKCYVCHRKFGKGFTFHHKYYVPGEKTYRDFENGDDYNEYIVKIVEKNPKQFLLLCFKHHFTIEQLKRFKKETLERIIKAVRMST